MKRRKRTATEGRKKNHIQFANNTEPKWNKSKWDPLAAVTSLTLNANNMRFRFFFARSFSLSLGLARSFGRSVVVFSWF